MSMRDLNKMVTRMKARALSMKIQPKKRKRPGRAPVPAQPIAIEKQYQAILNAYLTDVQAAVNRVILPALPRLLEQANENKPVTDRMDGWADDLDRMMSVLNKSLDKTMPNFSLMTLDIGQKTSKWNNVQWQKSLRQTMGVDLMQNEPWLNDQLKAFSKDNVLLINSLQDTALKDVESSVLSTIRTGGRAEEVSKGIQERFGVSRSRANLIARDQVSKLNGQLSELRQKDIGVTEYIWHTANDERVRATHKAHNGKKFKWSQPPAKTGHPGQDYQCRCWAEAVLDELLNPEQPVAPGMPVVPPAPAPAPAVPKPVKPRPILPIIPRMPTQTYYDPLASEMNAVKASTPRTPAQMEAFKKQHAVYVEQADAEFATAKYEANPDVPKALRWYQGAGYAAVNKPMHIAFKEGKPFTDRFEHNVANIIKGQDIHSRLAKDTILYRGSRFKGFDVSKLKVGDTMPRFGGFNSTTLSPKIATEFTGSDAGFLLRIKAKKGTKYTRVPSGSFRELEHLLPPASKYRIEKITPNYAKSPIERATIHLVEVVLEQ